MPSKSDLSDDGLHRDLHPTSEKVLKTLHLLNGESTASEIADHCGESRSNVGNHLRDYLDGFVSKTGTQETPGSRLSANVWSLTEAGERRAEMLDAPLSQSQVQSLAETNAERIDELESRLKTHEKYFNRILKELDMAKEPQQ